jgi:hypothetical protein
VSQRPYELDLYAARNRERAYEAVVTAIEDATPSVTKKEIAEAIGRKPPQISMMLSGPSNWTLDTVSDLLRPVHATMEYKVVYDADRPKSNVFNGVTSQTTGAGTTANLSAATVLSSSTLVATNASTVIKLFSVGPMR